MDLKNLVKSIQSFEGVTRKSSIENVTDILSDVYNISGNIVIDNDDDASAIDIGNNQVILFAADGIWGQLIDVNPYWAGYCAVLVNVNDIAAMGGKPLAMVNILSIKDEDCYDDVLNGIKDGCIKFNVPMVGGHLHPDGEVDSLGVAIIGIAQKDKIIKSSGANVNDKVIVAIDLDGAPHKEFALNWDTTYNKDPKLVQDQITAIQNLAEKELFTAGKDISNPGILGTLEMLLESSKKGAIVELNNIPKNPAIDWEQWLKSYPGSGFVFTAKEENCDKIISYLKDYSIKTAIVGEIIEDKKLYLEQNSEKIVLFDQKINPVFKNIN
ncbi:methanogenesis marker 2 protein [Methanobrevibacter sp. OttesenSCG-928-K11]|nr:methanogenesis marker 2 protein [Methanobrevibacter sp. OttesenSCG-928-K11]MDL2270829.1 methanogenesis marker 2 protein [Methanobrevibacter sp. OttesenSCG-928-I08]